MIHSGKNAIIKRQEVTAMKTIRYAGHAAHANAQDHRVRFVIGSVVVAIGAALWLAEMAPSLVG
jgi:hypothetical protein